jgi:hypothetical protein
VVGDVLPLAAVATRIRCRAVNFMVSCVRRRQRAVVSGSQQYHIVRTKSLNSFRLFSCSVHDVTSKQAARPKDTLHVQKRVQNMRSE